MRLLELISIKMIYRLLICILFISSIFSQDLDDLNIELKSDAKIYLSSRANKVIHISSKGDSLKLFQASDINQKIFKVLFSDGNKKKWGWIYSKKVKYVIIEKNQQKEDIIVDNSTEKNLSIEEKSFKNDKRIINNSTIKEDSKIEEAVSLNNKQIANEDTIAIKKSIDNSNEINDSWSLWILMLVITSFYLLNKRKKTKPKKSDQVLEKEHKDSMNILNNEINTHFETLNEIKEKESQVVRKEKILKEAEKELNKAEKYLNEAEKLEKKQSRVVAKNDKKNKQEIIERAYNKYLDNLVKDIKVSKSLNGMDQETKIKWFDLDFEHFESFQWYGKLNRRNTQVSGIDELKKDISKVDLPIRFSPKDKERDFSEIAVLKSLSDTFRRVRFLVKKLKIDYFSTEEIDGTDTLPVTDIASFTKRMSDDEQEIWDKNVNFSYKVSKVRSYDYLTFKKLNSEEVMIKSSYRKSIGLESKNFKNWLKNVYPKYSNLSKKEIGSGYNLFHRFFTNQNDYLAYINNPSMRYSFLFSVDKECAICRNDISDYHYHFYFCPVCIHLVDFKSFNKEFLKYQRSGIEREFNDNHHCIFNDCNKTSNSGYFCNEHKKKINQVLNQKNKNIFDIPDQSSDDFNRSATLINRQGKLFNQLILREYLNNKDLDLKKLFDEINNSNAVVSSKEECFNMIISLLLLEEKYKEAVDFYYKVLDLIDLSEYVKPDKRVGKSSQKEFITIDYDLAEMLKQVIINNQYDFHTIHAFKISSALIYSEDWSSYRFKSSRVKYDYAQEFAERFLKRLNKNKDFIYQNFPYDYTYYSFDDKKKLWYRYKEEDYYGGSSKDRKVKHYKDYTSIHKNAEKIIKIIMKSLPNLPKKYFHDGLPRPIEYPYFYDGGSKFKIYQKIDGTVSLKDKDSYDWCTEYDFDSYFIDEDVFERLNELNNENSSAFWFIDRILLTSDKVFRLMGIEKDKAIIFRQKLIKRYFDTISPEFCLSRRYSSQYSFDDYGKRDIYESSIDNDIKWVQKIIDLQDGIEDEIREKYDIPASKWKSEHQLYEFIKDYFPNEKVEKHGRPKWLKQQHLDIYFSQKNIGIEYQGEQHLRPIDFFGGEVGFKKTIERDKRKKQLCKKNNCTLIYVYPEDDYDSIVEEISKKL